MMTFIFRAGDHSVEPAGLFPANMPKSLAFHPPRGEMRGDCHCTVSSERVFHEMRVRSDAGEMEATAMRQVASRETPARKAPGENNNQGRLEDMRTEGIDAENVFAKLAVFVYVLEDVDAELVTHAEDTFPNGRLVTPNRFDGTDFSGREEAEILGSNAARLFRHHYSAVEVAA